MKIIKLLSLSWILLVVPKAISQEFKLGKVSIAELEQKVHPKDSSAAAAILYKKGISRMEFDQNEGFCIVTDVEARIKIYKKEGYNWATIHVGVPAGKANQISITDVYTYNLIDGKIVNTSCDHMEKCIFDLQYRRNACKMNWTTLIWRFWTFWPVKAGSA